MLLEIQKKAASFITNQLKQESGKPALDYLKEDSFLRIRLKNSDWGVRQIFGRIVSIFKGAGVL